jgi:predicted transcriptional regulator
MRSGRSRPNALQSVAVLEVLESLAVQHGAAGVPFKDLEAAIRSRLNYRALTDALNALVNEGAVQRVTEKPARLAITEAGRKRLNEYRS